MDIERQHTACTDRLIGTTIDGRFAIRRLIGEGGMGAVYEAFQFGLETPVAVKVLHARFLEHTDVLKRFQSEARITSSLKHDNVVATHAFGLLDGTTPFFVMELVEGISVSDLLRESGTLDKATFVHIFTQCCSGLLAAHQLGIVHRDIKPSNIMLVKQPDGRFLVKLTDFGIAKSEVSSSLQSVTRTGQVIGTPVYMSPEQCEAKPVDHRSDIYSLGCVMYECLTGKPPFASDNAYETMLQHINVEPESPTERRAHLRTIRPIVDAVMHTLQKDPNCRPQTMAQLRSELLDADRGVSNFQRKRVLRLPSWTWKVVACMVLLCGAMSLVFAHQLSMQKEFVNDNDPEVMFGQAEAMQKDGRTENAARRYMQYLYAVFGPSPGEDGIWHAHPGFSGEANLRRILQAAQGVDAWHGAKRDHWYQAKSAADAYFLKTGGLPPWAVTVFEAKAAKSIEEAQTISEESRKRKQLEFAEKLTEFVEHRKQKTSAHE